MKCQRCQQDSRFYEPGGKQNFCEHCGEPLDAASDRWINEQVERDLKRMT